MVSGVKHVGKLANRKTMQRDDGEVCIQNPNSNSCSVLLQTVVLISGDTQSTQEQIMKIKD